MELLDARDMFTAPLVGYCTHVYEIGYGWGVFGYLSKGFVDAPSILLLKEDAFVLLPRMRFAVTRFVLHVDGVVRSSELRCALVRANAREALANPPFRKPSVLASQTERFGIADLPTNRFPMRTAAPDSPRSTYPSCKLDLHAHDPRR